MHRLDPRWNDWYVNDLRNRERVLSRRHEKMNIRYKALRKRIRDWSRENNIELPDDIRKAVGLR